MGTKLSELRNGCFHRALDDEPMFVLLARDPHAPELTRQWSDEREREIKQGKRPASDMAQVVEARQCADNMEAWRRDNDGAWREGLFATDKEPFAPIVPPTTCRMRLRDEGKPYPRSGCDACKPSKPLTVCPYNGMK